MLPGSVAAVDEPGCPVEHPYDPATIYASNETKTAYLRDMQARRMPEVEAAKAGWAHPEIDVLAALKEWFTPLLMEAEHIAGGIDGGVRFTCEDAERGDVDILIDFAGGTVREYAGEKVRYRFRTRRAYLEQLIAEHEIDWVNSLFLSCRFSAQRIGPYNEFVYVFFKCLSEERVNYAEGWFAEQNATEAAETIELERVGDAAALPAPQGRPVEVRHRRRRRPQRRGHDLPDARVAVAPARRQVPEFGRPRPALRAGRRTTAGGTGAAGAPPRPRRPARRRVPDRRPLTARPALVTCGVQPAGWG